ncbi:hypothetical protein [Streptomyces litchfieldiae]|uniref:Large polyvalent protein associated domain-containing protein n=1 Tax=Streptomyces litchfieldiae TaxID=3075543 RepID=A0ABU2MI78_9ACTN|nr:hypothetical protein [Streptomyces sp. DSM 44938]MDT0341287.1 hypothetical protein [Streptomyces sp. DSM 44938]
MTGPNFQFTQGEVVAKAGGADPWATQTKFSNEIDIPAMLRAGLALREAAEGAREVKDLAASADAISESSASQNGAPLAASADRSNETGRNVQEERINQAVDYNFRAMGTASTTKASVEEEVTGPNGLDTRVQNYGREAQADWDYWETLRQELDGQFRNAPPTAVLPTVVHKGRQVKFGRLADDTVTLPPELPAQIREDYLTIAGNDARDTDGRINESITTYRRALMEMAATLSESGYDVASGPVDLFTSPEMAQWAAEGLNQEMQRPGGPDEQNLEMYTQGLEAITGGVFGDPHVPGKDAQRDLTPQESTYLQRFFNTATADSLAKLGLSEDLGGFAKQNVANGIDMLMNPDIGGINTSGTGGTQQVPDSIREYLYGYGQRVTDQASVDRFNGFGKLMDSSALTPGGDFARALGTAALDVQQAVDRVNAVSPDVAENAAGGDTEALSAPDEPLRLTGSSDLLSHTALNQEASIDLLGTSQATREGLLTAEWQDGQGIADVIHSAIQPGENGTLTAEQKAAADGVLNFYTDNPDELIADWTEDQFAPRIPLDAVPIQGAVAETALRRMDDIVGLRQPHPQYSEEDMYGVFSLMAASDPTVNEYFKTGVNATQYDLAYDLYSGATTDKTNVLQNIGDLNQLVSWGEQDVKQHYQDREDKEAKLQRDLTIASAGAALSLGGLAGGPVAVGASLSGAGLGVAIPGFGEFEAQAPKVLAEYQLVQGPTNTELMQHALVAGAAAARGENITVPDADTLLRSYEGATGSRVLNFHVNQAQDALGLADDVDLATTGSGFVPPFSEHDGRVAAERLKRPGQVEG